MPACSACAARACHRVFAVEEGDQRGLLVVGERPRAEPFLEVLEAIVEGVLLPRIVGMTGDQGDGPLQPLKEGDLDHESYPGRDTTPVGVPRRVHRRCRDGTTIDLRRSIRPDVLLTETIPAHNDYLKCRAHLGHGWFPIRNAGTRLPTPHGSASGRRSIQPASR